MADKLPVSMRHFIFSGWLWLICLPVWGQNIFEIIGPREVYCADSSVHYTLNTDSGTLIQMTQWQLIPSNGGQILTSGPKDAFVLFFQPGTYTLVAFSQNPNGFYSDSIQIYVYGTPIPLEIAGCYEIATGSKCYQVCAYSSTTIYTILGSEWEVIGAESYTTDYQSQVTIQWGAGGMGEFVIYEGCETHLCFEILPEPVPDFSTLPAFANDTVTICKGQEIQFENHSVNGLSYQWDFGDGQQSVSFDATHTYTTDGYYTVTLSAESICLCAGTKSIVVEVLPAPAPELDCVNSVCPETRQRYTATTNGCSTFYWSVSSNGTIVNGGGLSDDFIEIIWHDGPDGFIYLAVDGCATQYCSFTNTFRIPIISPEGPVMGDASVCSGEIVTYEAPYFPGTEYHWQIGSFGVMIGNDNMHTLTVHWDEVNGASASFVSVQYDNCFLECGGQDQLQVMIVPEITLTGNAQVCKDGTASASAFAGFGAQVPANVEWHIENPQGQTVYTQGGLTSGITHTFSYPPGLYEWVAVNRSSAYCNEVVRLSIAVTATPDIPLGIKGEDVICAGQPFGYTIVSAGAYKTIWTITDGPSTFTYQGQSCQHTFGASPPYKVEAAHADIQYSACVSSPVSMTLTTADDHTILGPADVCFNAIDAYSFPLISGADYTWEILPADYGEIKKSNLNEAEIFWTQSGSATIRLHACGSSIELPVTVHALPVFALAGPTAACSNELVSVSTDQPAMSHRWSDENGNILSTLTSSSLSPGAYAVEVTDALGCVNEQTFEITSYPAPVVNLTTAADNLFCSVIPAGVDIVANTDGADYMYTWFQDGVNIGPGGPVYTVHDFANYHVEVMNQYGCTAVSPGIEFLDCCPPNNCSLAGSLLPSACTYIPFDFDVKIGGAECQVRQYQPQFPGFEPDSSRWIIFTAGQSLIAIVDTGILDYTYLLPGYYKLILVSKITGFPYGASDCGHLQILTDTIRAVADFKNEGSCASDPISFEDLSTFLPGETIISWAWDFGDPGSGINNVSSLQNPNHVFALPGDYEVTLTLTIASGCISVKKQIVHISGGPVLTPTYDAIYCENEALSFVLAGEVFDVAWIFGDPLSGIQNMAGEAEAFHTYDNPGLYTTSVAASDIYGCRSQVSIPVDIRINTLSGLIDAQPGTSVCFGDTVTLTAPPVGQTYTWSNGDTAPQTDVTESDSYTVLIRDQFQCAYTPPAVFVEIVPKPEVIIRAREILGSNQYGPWDTTLQLCYGTEFEIQAFASGSVSWQWTHGETTSIIQFTDEGGNLPGVGTHTYSVFAENPFGCYSDTTSISIEIFPLPNYPFISLESGTGCGFGNNILQVMNPEAGVTYQWSDGQEGIMISANNTGTYIVTAINANGCSRISNDVWIRPAAAVDQIPGGCFIKCDPLTVCLPQLDLVASYNLYQNGVLIQSGTAWPSDYMITTDGSYVIEVTTLNGCTATSDPLNVVLYPGVGSVTVLTYFDTDGDGVISAGDQLIPGINVILTSDDGLHTGMTNTESNGGFVFEDYPTDGYTAFFNQDSLPSQYKILIDSVTASITTCGDSTIVSLLLTNNCIVGGPDQIFELCPGDLFMLGDSIWSDTGSYEMHMWSALGCDSVFQVSLLWPDTIDIGVTVWVDVDQNGVVSPADTVISGITILFDHLINQLPLTGLTDQNGQTNGAFDAGSWWIYIDSGLLPPGYMIILGEDFVYDTTCGFVAFDFLLAPSCSDVFIIQHETLCPGDSIEVEGQWIHDPGLYSIVLSAPGSNCDSTLELYVTLYPEIQYAAITSWNCVSLGTIELDITGSSPFTIDWSIPNQGDSLLTNLDAGAYTFFIADQNGCSISDEAVIVESPPLSFSLPSFYQVMAGDTIQLDITGDILSPGLIFEWSSPGILTCNNCPTPFAFPLSDTTLTVTITDFDSCMYVLNTVIDVYTDSTVIDRIYVPNVFSPNGDGYNDRWTIFSRMENTYVNRLTLFDRWGQLIFYKEEFDLDTFDGWDGTFKGKSYNPGVFVYMAELTLGDGRKVKVRGDVTLVR